MTEYLWPVMPICHNQKLDVHPNDLLNDDLYRKCDVYKYKAGGGYDKFPSIWTKYNQDSVGISTQFVVQLKGCPLKCPYCYVTPDGVHSNTEVYVGTKDLIKAYTDSSLRVFHLMGGAPALHLPAWKDLAYHVDIFHSDFLLIEYEYDIKDLRGLPGLHAVSLKEKSMYTDHQLILMILNMRTIIQSGINYYVTLTGDAFSTAKMLHDAFGGKIFEDISYIGIKEYNAIKKDNIR